MLRARSLVAHAAVRCFATSAPTLPTLAEVKGWDVTRVLEFAKSESVGLDDDDVQILSANKVKGKDLLSLTEDKLRADGMPRGPAVRLATVIAELRDTHELVTLTMRSKGGNASPSTFTPSRFQAFVSSGIFVFHVTKDGGRKRLIQTLDEAKCVIAPDYLLLATPFDTVADLDGFTRDHASGLEQQTTCSIAKDPAFIKQHGSLTALADGEPVIFHASDGKPLLEAGGLVKSSVCLLFHEAKHSPREDDVQALETRTKMLRELLADPVRVKRTSPPDIMVQLADIREVAPVLSGHHFEPRVRLLCRQLGVTPVTTDGDATQSPQLMQHSGLRSS